MRTVVLGEHTIGVGDQDAATGVAVAGRDLGDARPGPGGLVGEGEKPTLVALATSSGGIRTGAERSTLIGETATTFAPATATARRGGSSLGGGRQPRLGEVGGVSEARGIADDNPDASASVAPAGQFLDPTIVEYRRRGALVLDEHFGKFTTGSHRGG